MAIQPIKFLVSPSATATNGSKIITVTGSVDCSYVYSGTAIALGARQVVEAVSGTKPDSSGNSTITLRDTWTEPTTTAKLVAFNTIEGLAEAIRRAREVVQASEAALSGNISYMGDHSAATGNFPAAPGEGLGSQIYRISIAGTISERQYKVGELIYYDQYFNQWRTFFDGLGSAAQRNIGSDTANVPDNAQLNVRLGTESNLGNAALRNVGIETANVPDNARLNVRLGTEGNLGNAAQRNVGSELANVPDNEQLNVRLGTEGNLGNAAHATVVSSPLDTTLGRVLKVGASGNQLGNDVYHRQNSVGTVSEVNGIPTGAIVQRGGGLTGKFTRFLDGTLFCFRREPTSSSPDIPFGSIFISNTMTRSTPATFVDAPVTSGDAPQKFVYVVGPRSAPWWAVNPEGQAPATNEWAFRVASSQSQSGQVVLVDLFAIGRWTKKDIEV